jgi:hypothetical protein
LSSSTRPSTSGETKEDLSKQLKRAEVKHQKRKEKWESYEIKVLQKKIKKLRKKQEKEKLSSGEESILKQAEVQLEHLMKSQDTSISPKMREQKEVALESVLNVPPETEGEEDTYVKLETSPSLEEKIEERLEIEDKLQR